jgi:hypothetical protein
MRHRFARLLLTAAVATTAGLAFAAPAWANTSESLHQSNVTLDGSAFDTCEGLTPTAGTDQWVFIWPDDNHNTLDELVSLNLTFSGGTRTKADVVGTVGGVNSSLKVVVTTPAGWVLQSGTAETVHSVSLVIGGVSMFNLTHGCAGTTSTSTPTPGASETASPTPGTSQTPGSSETPGTGTTPPTTVSSSPVGGLPVTGVAWGAMVLTAVGLIAAGVALMAVRRRRELTEDNAVEL